ncbi:putative protein phosphatase 2C [Gregarina niphandrodes]|uniref:Protein phosphatase n=1 Tax=Gregarina niphandrodes TaxID=110365 RepID=A0A023B941_GRENI|nr:putative protein phosphatase 2C [Gregarina niphandrodes]EZG70844.1 putative protein phosphatase 2C [Gregarina niphandrodes]|eukprot:XP_011129862.1 putative protein phosphatase 2C [Gregarina niphandrodes]
MPKTSKLKLQSGAWTISKPGKPNGGEDAYFALEHFAGVADGVGEWGDYGCCPRQFALALMEGSQEMALRQEFHARPNCGGGMDGRRASERALSVLRSGFERALQEKGCFGSSTSLVVGLDAMGEKLGIACLGDSSCIVLRRTRPIFRHMTITRRTREQQHFFNCPYQLSRLPQPEDIPQLENRGMFKLIRVLANIRPEMSSDSPDQADLIDIPVKEGDLILIGTDGLFDNLFDQEIIALASLALSPYEARLFTGPNRDRPSEPPQHPGSTESMLYNARKWTEDWVTGRRAPPSALDPPCVNQDKTIATPPGHVARGIAEAAFYRSIDSRAKSPFAKAARAAGASAVGGKQDDITVVACWVVSTD